MKNIMIILTLISTSAWAQSGRLQDKIQAEFGPEPTSLCQVGLLLENGQIQMLPSRFLKESECIWVAKSQLKNAKGKAKKAFLTHGDFKKEINLSDLK